MSAGNIDFSEKEMAFIQDQEFLLSKLLIGSKVEKLLGTIEQKLYPVVQNCNLPKEVLSKSGKISKGDNYQCLPYYILDYPRRFGKEDVFAFRTMFWWGNFFSASLHLSGHYLESKRAVLVGNIESLISSNAYICTNDSPWEYHFESDNYLPISSFSAKQLQSLFTTRPFLKISYNWPLKNYQQLPDFVLSAFIQTMGWIDEY